MASNDRRTFFSSSSSSRFPPIFPGQSLAHNLHEFVLGVLINSDGQNVLSKQSLNVQRDDAPPGNKQLLRQKGLQKHSPKASQRSVTKVERFERIPTWPTRNGLRFKAISQINPDLAAQLEHKYGGADCPNLWLSTAKETSPFLMMCHHNHSFNLNDPIRLLEKNVVPEGFPSHAHRGMTTVTICLRGGMVHRDSLGNKQQFGIDDVKKHGSKHMQHKHGQHRPYKGKHTQWLTFGGGIVHELMWDNDPKRNRGKSGNIIHQEIYQIWIDLPQSKRYMEPRVELLGDEEGETPIVVDTYGSKTTIIAGEHDGISASVDTISDLTILRVEMMDKPYQTWNHSPPSSHSTIIIYVRTGSITIGNNIRVPPHCTAYLSSHGKTLTVTSEANGADFLVMAGKPLNQRVTARGSMVVETPAELEDAFRDYEQGKMGVPWSESCTDAEWKRHLKNTQS